MPKVDKKKKFDVPRSLKLGSRLSFLTNELLDMLIVEIDIPGVLPQDLDVTVKENEINVVGKRLGVQFGQSIPFNRLKYDPSTIEGELSMGVLTLVMSATPTVETINVPISVLPDQAL